MFTAVDVDSCCTEHISLWQTNMSFLLSTFFDLFFFFLAIVFVQGSSTFSTLSEKRRKKRVLLWAAYLQATTGWHHGMTGFCVSAKPGDAGGMRWNKRQHLFQKPLHINHRPPTHTHTHTETHRISTLPLPAPSFHPLFISYSWWQMTRISAHSAPVQ